MDAKLLRACICLVLLIVVTANKFFYSQQCKDTKPKHLCEWWKKWKMCTKDYRLVEFCPATCDFCDGGGCFDVSYQCNKWKQAKACITHPRRMARFCAKSCGLCSARNFRAAHQPPVCANTQFGCCWDGTEAKGHNKYGCPACEDKLPLLCQQFKYDCKKNERDSNANFLKENCPKTCNYCQNERIASHCADHIENCEGLKADCYTAKGSAFMKKNCAKTCKLCVPSSGIPEDNAEYWLKKLHSVVMSIYGNGKKNSNVVHVTSETTKRRN